MFKTEEQGRASAESGRQDPQSDEERAVSAVLGSIAERKGTVITSVALAYVMHKTPYVFPVIGGRRLEHLKVNIEALTLSLSDEDIKAVDQAAPFDYGWPHTMLWGVNGFDNYQEVGFVRMNGQMDLVPDSKVRQSSFITRNCANKKPTQPIKPSRAGE